MDVIKNKVINDMEIFIKYDTYSVDAVYKKDEKVTSFKNYGRSYQLDLFEYNENLYLIARSDNNTLVMPIYITNDYVTYGHLSPDCINGYIADENLENLFQQGFFK